MILPHLLKPNLKVVFRGTAAGEASPKKRSLLYRLR
jgi:hypothetical protein